MACLSVQVDEVADDTGERLHGGLEILVDDEAVAGPGAELDVLHLLAVVDLVAVIRTA
jgi:hypothetical protein